MIGVSLWDFIKDKKELKIKWNLIKLNICTYLNTYKYSYVTVIDDNNIQLYQDQLR